MLELHEVLPHVKPDFERYAEHEREVLTPALQDAGVEVYGPWRNGEADSLGPLSRCVDTSLGTVVYG